MKKLFLVFAKLLGLYQFFLSILGTVQLFAMLAASMGGFHFASFLLGLAGVLLFLAVSLGIAWLLIVKTEWLAQTAGIRDETPVEGLERVPALVVGISLIGVYLAISGISPLTRAFLSSRHLWSEAPFLVGLQQVLPAALQVALGMLLALKPGGVARRLAPTSVTP